MRFIMSNQSQNSSKKNSNKKQNNKKNNHKTPSNGTVNEMTNETPNEKTLSNTSNESSQVDVTTPDSKVPAQTDANKKTTAKDSTSESAQQQIPSNKAAPSKSNEKKKETVQSTKNNSTKNKPAKKQSNNNEQPSSQQKRKTPKLSILAIILSLGIGGIMVTYVEQLSSQIDMIQSDIQKERQQQANYRASLTEAQATITKLESELTERIGNSDSTIAQQQNKIEELTLLLSDLKGRHPNDWLLAEADYLIKLAGRKLFLEKDIISAVRLLETADQRVASLNEPNLMPLRKSIAKDAQALKAMARVDREGLVLKLITLQQHIDSLPIDNAVIPEEVKEAEQTVSNDITNWKDNLSTSFNHFFEKFITVRVREGEVVPLLSPKQHFYLRENIKSKIETAITAVNKEDNELYQASLQLTEDWSKKFFAIDTANVRSFLEELASLKSMDVTVNYPAKLHSSEAIKHEINDRLSRNITSLVSEKKQQQEVSNHE